MTYVRTPGKMPDPSYLTEDIINYNLDRRVKLLNFWELAEILGVLVHRAGPTPAHWDKMLYDLNVHMRASFEESRKRNL